jgi:hypothetical protein
MAASFHQKYFLVVETAHLSDKKIEYLRITTTEVKILLIRRTFL